MKKYREMVASVMGSKNRTSVRLVSLYGWNRTVMEDNATKLSGNLSYRICTLFKECMSSLLGVLKLKCNIIWSLSEGCSSSPQAVLD